jgi:hypothetical protein
MDSGSLGRARGESQPDVAVQPAVTENETAPLQAAIHAVRGPYRLGRPWRRSRPLTAQFGEIKNFGGNVGVDRH